ncbi:DUF2933 domain-containing protein [Cupriavidus necator]
MDYGSRRCGDCAWRPHWSHLASWLPFALVFLCPLMHFFPWQPWGPRQGRGNSKSDDSVDARPNN